MLNHVTLTGKVTDAGPKLTYGETGQPECRWTLAIEEPGAQRKTFTTYVPCSAYGKAVETIAEQLEPGMLVCIRDGRLKFRRTLVKGEQVNKLEVSCWQVSVLTPAAAPAHGNEGGRVIIVVTFRPSGTRIELLCWCCRHTCRGQRHGWRSPRMPTVWRASGCMRTVWRAGRVTCLARSARC